MSLQWKPHNTRKPGRSEATVDAKERPVDILLRDSGFLSTVLLATKVRRKNEVSIFVLAIQ